MKITWQNLSVRFSRSGETSTCGLSSGAFFLLQPLFNSLKDPGSTLGVRFAQWAEPGRHLPILYLVPPPLSSFFWSPHFLLLPFHSPPLGPMGTFILHPVIEIIISNQPSGRCSGKREQVLHFALVYLQLFLSVASCFSP